MRAWFTNLMATLAMLLCCAAGIAVAQSSEATTIRAASPEVFQAIRQIYEYNRKTPLQAQLIGKENFPTYTREKLVFTGIQHSRVPTYLAIPKSGSGPFPVVILIDGIGGSKARWFEVDSWQRGTLVVNALIESGFSAMALDARFHGERAAENDYQIPTDMTERRDMVVQSVIEHRRAMDYLATRPEIDTNRIGVLGLSMGGMLTFALASVDSRIKTAIAGLTPVGILKEPVAIPVAPQTFAGAIVNTPILMLMARKDNFYKVEEAQQLFDAIKGRQKELVFYDTNHRPPGEYATKAMDWFMKYLK